jgi:hypothetical protein
MRSTIFLIKSPLREQYDNNLSGGGAIVQLMVRSRQAN